MNVTAYYLPEKIFHIKHPVNIRYWFWRLDYYLWEQRSTFFNEEEQKIVEHLCVFGEIVPYLKHTASSRRAHTRHRHNGRMGGDEAVHSFWHLLAMILTSFANSQQVMTHNTN